ncbi:MAG: DNA polymerase III subunit gamma/tau [Mycoplasmataceae bacterium]|nr:DNA polymerase III subunit gamma/tau [Mycoplasmataceae bacterium]
MLYQSLYNKYRPTSFSQIIGQDLIVKSLRNCIKDKQIPLAYIFSGPKGIGKTTIARILAKAVNCLQPKDGDPCNSCSTCKLFKDNAVLDLIEVDAASNNGVENIRTIIENSNYVPTELKYRVFIIDEAHMLTTSAWNALLKTLEEGKPYALFIFATTEVHKIPATITSRCLQYNFKQMNHAHLLQLAQMVTKQEKIKITNDAIDRLIEIADGSARDLLSSLEQVWLTTNSEITINDVNKQFLLIDNATIINFLNQIANNQTQNCLQEVDQWIERGINLQWFMNCLLQILFDKLVYLQTKELSLLKKTSLDEINSLTIDAKTAKHYIDIWLNIKIGMLASSESKFHILNAIFKCLGYENYQPASNGEKPIIAKPQPVINKPKEEMKVKQEPKQTTHSKDLSLKDIFFSICQYHQQSLQVKINERFNELKSKRLISSGELSSFSGIKSIPIVSSKGFVIIFDDKNDADLFNNEARFNVELLKSLEENFHSLYYIVALDNATMKAWGKEFKELKTKSAFANLDLIPLYERIKKNNPVEDLMKDYLNKE